ncbi:ABC transporter substrate-binding protein [Kitasatospora sp. NPDC094015]|uniref:ABC transporter substrate-binding protein n=1 Tax=Kitasatospora sp. NPDC094015 TaxID=3155205 RepID=UPI003327847A
MLDDSRTPSRLLAALGAGGLLLSGCASAEVGPGGGQSGLRARIPEQIKKAGLLRIASNLNYAPVDFKGADGNPAGIDPELAAAIGRYLGLKVTFVDMPFEKVIPAVQAKEVDLAMSAVIDTKQRQDGTDEYGRQKNPGVDFIDYFMTGTSILVRTGNPLGINNLDSLCGRTVAVQRGTVQDELAQRQTAACTKLGKPLQIHSLDTDDKALAEVAAGTAAADLNDYPVAEYNTKSADRGGRFQLAGGYLQPGPYGITVNKESADLRYVVSKALDQLIRNGEYDKLLAKWNVESGAVSSAVVNGGL